MNIGDMMPASQKKEMVDFFQRELQTPTWMRALSTKDLDVTFSIRPDHQWTGAYCSWPALALSGLYAAGEVDVAYDWIKGLAKTSMQGPYAQAHFTETFYRAGIERRCDENALRSSLTSTIGRAFPAAII